MGKNSVGYSVDWMVPRLAERTVVSRVGSMAVKMALLRAG
jgi:hypothetical protein